MTQITEDFKNYRLIHNFISDEPLKAWINEGCFNDIYKADWNALMEVVDKLENQGVEITIGRMFCEIKYQDVFNKDKHFDIRIVSGVKINAVNGAIVELIKWYNKNK